MNKSYFGSRVAIPPSDTKPCLLDMSYRDEYEKPKVTLCHTQIHRTN